MTMLLARWRFIRLALIFIALLTLVAGCRSVAPASTPAPTPTLSAAEAEAAAEAMAAGIAAAFPLAATAWDLDFFGTPEESQPPLPDTRASLTFFWDRYLGFDGCSWLLGVYSANTEGELQIGTPLRTPNLCGPDEFIEQSALFSSWLIALTEYSIEGEQLIGSTVNEQRLLTFNPAQPIPMPGTEWELKFWWDAKRGQWYPVVPLSSTTITFSLGGEASGSGGCNNYTVSYAGDLQIEKVMEASDTYAELPTLTFGPVAAQMAACAEPENIMEQEQGFFIALGSTAYYFKLGGMLMLLDAEGVPLIVLAARD
jgi:heat shock protein HslJ